MTLLDRYIEATALRAIVLVAATLTTLFSLLEFVEQLASVGQGHYRVIDAFVYVVLTVAFLPLARPSALAGLDRVHGLAVAYCLVATVTAYLAFAEALAHWEGSRVASACSLIPVITVLAVALTHHLAPGLIPAERIALAGWVGAALIVSGSALSSLARGR